MSNELKLKLCWNIYTHHGLWSDYMYQTYLDRHHLATYPLIGSLHWRMILKYRDKVIDNSTWFIGDGHVSF